jgi:hypothetical protein
VFTPRFVRIAVWVLAVILPGGLFMLALWASARAVRARYLVRTDAPALQLPSIAQPSARQCTARS